MTTLSMTVTLVSKRPGEVDVETVVEHDFEEGIGPDGLTCEQLSDAAVEIADAARKAVASRSVDYDSFSSDSAYLEALDARAREFYVVDMAAPGAQTVFSVDGEYDGDPDHAGRWGDQVSAASVGEAEFQARWIMAANASYYDRQINEGAVDGGKLFEKLVDRMDIQTIDTGMIRAVVAADATP